MPHDESLRRKSLTPSRRPPRPEPDLDTAELEFDLLRYLLDREGTAVGRRAILRDVWGTEWTGGSNVIETVISTLRRKLGRHAGMIETVRGVGCRSVVRSACR